MEAKLQTDAAAPAASWIACVVACLLAAAAAVLTPILQIRGKTVFEDFAVELPVMTRLFLTLPAVVVMAVCVVLAVALLVKEMLVASSGVKLLANLAALILALLYLGVAIAAVFIPLMNLMDALS